MPGDSTSGVPVCCDSDLHLQPAGMQLSAAGVSVRGDDG